MDDKFLPVKETIELIDFGISFQQALSSSLEDGKITVLELPSFLGSLLKISAGLNGINKIPSELATDENKQLVTEYFADKFDLKDDVAELLIEDTIRWIVNTYSLGARWAKHVNS